MIEPEIAFADLQDDMRLAEDMIKYIMELGYSLESRYHLHYRWSDYHSAPRYEW